jgi:hypothetical protein
MRVFSSTTDSLYVAERGAIVGSPSGAALISISCESTQLEETVKAHEGLRIVQGPTRLRPLSRRSFRLQRYCCRMCNANLLFELNPLQPEHSD